MLRKDCDSTFLEFWIPIFIHCALDKTFYHVENDLLLLLHVLSNIKMCQSKYDQLHLILLWFLFFASIFLILLWFLFVIPYNWPFQHMFILNLRPLKHMIVHFESENLNLRPLMIIHFKSENDQRLAFNNSSFLANYPGPLFIYYPNSLLRQHTFSQNLIFSNKSESTSRRVIHSDRVV